MPTGPAAEAAPEVLSVLAGARVRRVDVPEQDLVAITLLIGRQTATLLISAAENAPGIGLVDERPRGAPAGSFAQLLRKHLAGAAIERVTTPGLDVAVIGFRRQDERADLWLSVRRRTAGVVLVDAEGRHLGGVPRGPASVEPTMRAAPDPSEWPRDLDELRVAGHALMKRRAGAGDDDRHAALRRALVRARARVERRARAIEGDLAAARVAPELRAEGTLLLSSLGAIEPRTSEIALADPETGGERRITLDPTLSPADNAERRFVKARKLDRGARIATLRLGEATSELERFDAALASLATGDVAPAEELVRSPASRARVAVPTPARRAPYRTFALADGATILVGRGARQNDALTFRHAAPADTFFHVRGRTGAHVILRVPAGAAPSEDARMAAAALAAHFSAARTDTAVDVSCAARRDLRRGRAPGSVIMRTSSTLRVRMSDYPLAPLLAREVGS